MEKPELKSDAGQGLRFLRRSFFAQRAGHARVIRDLAAHDFLAMSRKALRETTSRSIDQN